MGDWLNETFLSKRDITARRRRRRMWACRGGSAAWRWPFSRRQDGKHLVRRSRGQGRRPGPEIAGPSSGRRTRHHRAPGHRCDQQRGHARIEHELDLAEARLEEKAPEPTAQTAHAHLAQHAGGSRPVGAGRVARYTSPPHRAALSTGGHPHTGGSAGSGAIRVPSRSGDRDGWR